MSVSALKTAESDECFLVVIDVQERLMAAMPEGTRDAILKQIGILLQASTALKIPVTITEQYPRGLGSTEAELLSLSPSTATVEKTCFSCVDADDFMTSLRKSGRRSVILTGMEAHICVLQTALTLQGQGYQVFVVEDGVSSRTPENKNNALQRMRQAGVIITNTESVLFEWLADAKHAEFRTLSKLII
ncbi:MAG: isochorismatase family protein [Methylococcaceae bacterium]|nr:isochorismatase family protein [Methylococcaceae bacterium]